MCKLSIIIPLYQAQDWVEKCIRNLLKLDIRSYEILLVNDGSTDQTEAICRRLVASEPRIRLISQKNQGVSTARNTGIEHAKGEYLLFQDVDDETDVEVLGRIFGEEESWKNQDLVLLGAYFDYYYHGKCYRSDLTSYPTDGLLSKNEWKRELMSLYSSNSLNSVWAKLFRRDLLVRHEIRFCTEMFLYEDLEFVLRYLKVCDGICNYSAGVYHYRIEEEKNNPGNRLKRIPDLNQYMERLEDAFGELIEADAWSKDIWLQKERILTRLYLILIREKSEVSSPKEIGKICQNARLWLENKDPKIIEGLSDGEKSVMELFADQKVWKIIFRREYLKLRHKVALVVKNHGH